MQLLIYVGMDSYIFVLNFVPTFAIGSSFSWHVCPFDIFSSLCFFSSTVRLQVHLVILRHSHKINQCFKNPLFLLLEHGIRNQNLSAKCAYYYKGAIAYRPLQLTEQENICVYTKPCVYVDLRRSRMKEREMERGRKRKNTGYCIRVLKSALKMTGISQSPKSIFQDLPLPSVPIRRSQ